MISITTNHGATAFLDDQDVHLARFRWCDRPSPTGIIHAWRQRSRAEIAERPGPRIVYLHREVMGAWTGDQGIDHVDRNGLNCQRANLRWATKAQNGQNVGKRAHNKSGFRGVSRIRRFKNGREVNLARPWLAQIQAHGVHEYLGLYSTPEEAARVWDAAAIRLHGSFSRLNFTQESEACYS